MIHRSNRSVSQPACGEGFAVPPMPRIIHQMWLPNWQQTPANLRDTRTAWCARNPMWQLMFWGLREVEDLIVQHYPQTLDLWAALDGEPIIKRADMARLLVLHRFGGLYADMDLLPLKQLTIDVAKEADWLLAAEYTEPNEKPRVCNGFIGACRPRQRALLDLVRAAHVRSHWPVLDFLGPRVVSGTLLHAGQAVVLPWEAVLSTTPDSDALTHNLNGRAWGQPPAAGQPWYSC